MASIPRSGPAALGRGTSSEVGPERWSRARVRRRDPAPTDPPVSSARIAIAILLMAETMFFAGLVGAYLVFRYGRAMWPPPNLPHLPLALTWVNTVILSVSGLTMISALRAVRRDAHRTVRRAVLATLILGTTFLLVQGSEWVRLIHHGLTLSSGSFGATFYTLIGAHAVHVVGAILWLAVVAIGVFRQRFTAASHVALEVCGVYWCFVCALWLALFGLVYQ